MLENLQKLREMTGRGQFWLAKATGIERSKLSLFENGRLEPTKEELAQILAALRNAMRENAAEFNRLVKAKAA